MSVAARLRVHDQQPAPAKPERRTRVIRAAPGEIRADAAYTLRELSARLNLKRWGIASMEQAGLKVRRFNGRSFVLGADVIRFLQELP